MSESLIERLRATWDLFRGLKTIFIKLAGDAGRI